MNFFSIVWSKPAWIVYFCVVTKNLEGMVVTITLGHVDFLIKCPYHFSQTYFYEDKKEIPCIPVLQKQRTGSIISDITLVFIIDWKNSCFAQDIFLFPKALFKGQKDIWAWLAHSLSNSIHLSGHSFKCLTIMMSMLSWRFA